MHTTDRKQTIIFEPNHIKVEFSGDKTIAQVAAENGLHVAQPCGGCGSCGKCKVRILLADPPSYEERKLLTIGNIRNGIRLACMTKAEDGMMVFLDTRTGTNAQILKLSKMGNDEVVLPEITRENLQSLFDITPETGIYGVALDIGTTTLVASLVDLDSGSIVGHIVEPNPQHTHGDDVAARIAYASLSKENLQRMRSALIGTVNTMIVELARRQRIDTNRIFHMVAAGNTVMEHLFMGEDPSPLGRAPFEPLVKKFPRKRAEELYLFINPDAYVDLMPIAGGAAGGDVTAGIYYLGLHREEERRFMIDLGANSEMVVGNSDGLLVCSVATGPAIEGARVKDGMRMLPGAIHNAWIRNRFSIEYNTVGGVAPVGISGSGLVDLVEALSFIGVILEDGSLSMQNLGNSYQLRLWESVRKGPSGMELPVAVGEEREIVLTQGDVREVQLAKGAIAAGAEALFEQAGLAPDNDLAKAYMAGTFGCALNKESALALGFVPPLKPSKIAFAGDTALLGCVKALLSSDYRAEVDDFLTKTRYLNLASMPDFPERLERHLKFKIGG